MAYVQNTMHKVSDTIMKGIDIPFLHIAHATGQHIQEQNVKKVGLLGTKFTLQEDFYIQELEDNFPVEMIVPYEKDIEIINRVIYTELCSGVISMDSKKEFVRIISELADRGAEGVIAGCTEITLLISQSDIEVQYFDTTHIHAQALAHAATQQ